MCAGESASSADALPRCRMIADPSLANSIKKLGYDFEWIKDASDFDKAEVRLP